MFWADLYAPALYGLDPVTGTTEHWKMPETIGCFALCEGGGFIVALRSGLYHFEPHTQQLSLINQPDGEPRPGTRFNDGKVSPDGRLFVGTMDELERSRPIGALYRLDPDGCSQRVVDDLIVSNGLAWSPDGRTLYHADTRAGIIWCRDYDMASGALGHCREFVRPPAACGLPDGGAVDEEGCYWSAGVFAGVLNRWTPDGRLDRQIRLPCEGPTMPCFGGPDLKTLYITSLSKGLSEASLTTFPCSGGIFALEVDVPGVPVASFRGTALAFAKEKTHA